MPVAIRMANGATYYPGGFNHSNTEYYPEGFEHFSRGNKNQTKVTTTKAKGVAGYSRVAGQSNGMNPEKYAEYMQKQGYVKNTTSLRPDWEWVLPDTLSKLQKAEERQKAVNTAVNAVKSAPGKVAKAADIERRRLGVGYHKGVYEYDRSHGENGSAVGRTLAGVGGAVKNSTAYNVGKAAVTNAGRMLANGAKFVGGKVAEGAKFVGGKAVGAFNNIKGAVGKAAGNVAEFAKSAAGRVAKDFKDVARAIGKTALGEAARRAGETALKAGGSVVNAVGGALEGIVKFFGGAYNTAKNNITGQTYKNEDKALKKAGAGR